MSGTVCARVLRFVLLALALGAGSGTGTYGIAIAGEEAERRPLRVYTDEGIARRSAAGRGKLLLVVLNHACARTCGGRYDVLVDVLRTVASDDAYVLLHVHRRDAGAAALCRKLFGVDWVEGVFPITHDGIVLDRFLLVPPAPPPSAPPESETKARWTAFVDSLPLRLQAYLEARSALAEATVRTLKSERATRFRDWVGLVGAYGYGPALERLVRRTLLRSDDGADLSVAAAVLLRAGKRAEALATMRRLPPDEAPSGRRVWRAWLQLLPAYAQTRWELWDDCLEGWRDPLRVRLRFDEGVETMSVVKLESTLTAWLAWAKSAGPEAYARAAFLRAALVSAQATRAPERLFAGYLWQEAVRASPDAEVRAECLLRQARLRMASVLDPADVRPVRELLEEAEAATTQPTRAAWVGRALARLRENPREAVQDLRGVAEASSDAVVREALTWEAVRIESGDRPDFCVPSASTSGPLAPTPAPASTDLVVSPSSDGLNALAEACRTALPGTVIRVRPGVYSGAIVVDQSLTIVGVGDRGAVVLEADQGSVLECKGGSPRIANLTLRRTGSDDKPVVNLAGGTPTLEDCVVTGSPVSGVFTGSSELCRIVGCRIHGNGQAGVYVLEGGRAFLRRNDLVENGIYGVAVGEDSWAELRANAMSGNALDGLNVREGGVCEAYDNEITENAECGVRLYGEGSTLLLEGNLIADNAEHGIACLRGARGYFSRNTVRGNRKDGIHLSSKLDCFFTANRVSDSGEGGVRILYDARVVFQDTEVSGSTERDWILPRGEASGVIRRWSGQ